MPIIHVLLVLVSVSVFSSTALFAPLSEMPPGVVASVEVEGEAGGEALVPAPEPTPLPVPTSVPTPTPAPQANADQDGTFTVTLSIRADILLANMDALHRDKRELVPADGFILRPTAVPAEPGDTLFDLLQRETRQRRIHMASRFTPLQGGAYVEAIHNLYEFDAGPLSGWVFFVNGVRPNTGSSQQMLQPGDILEWVFSLELGEDVAPQR